MTKLLESLYHDSTENALEFAYRGYKLALQFKRIDINLI